MSEQQNRNHQGSSQETHRKLVEEFQNACCEAELAEQEEPNIDFSFLYEQETSARKKRRKSGKWKVAAASVLIVLLGANMLLLATNGNDAYGDKGILHRIQAGLTGLFTDEEEVDEDGIRETLTISSMDDIDKAKNFLPELYIPHYIPAGYALESLTIREFVSGTYTCEYIFEGSSDENFHIILNYINGDMFYQSAREGEIIAKSDRTIYVTQDNTDGKYALEVYLEDCQINISKIDDEAVGLKIAEGLAL